MDVNAEQRNTWIALGVLAGLSLFVAIFQTWKWFGRSSRDVIDLPTIGKFFFNIIGLIGTVILLVVSGVCVYWLIRFKRTYDDTEFENANGFENILRILLVVAFVLKTLDILHLIVRQSTIDIFFMDWERPKGGKTDSVSIWRSFFVANEFNEIQTFRRIHVPFQLFFVLFFLRVVNFEYIALRRGDIPPLSSSLNCTTGVYSIFHVGLGFLIFLGTGLIQYVIFTLIYQRLFEDKILNFIDLCSVSNISVFILDQSLHGYYIHGRSPHGLTDVNMKTLLMNFDRERNGLSGYRGLEDKTDDQLFIMKISRSFRREYDDLYRTYNTYTNTRPARGENDGYADVLLKSYQNLNGFLCAFIDRSLAGHRYFLRSRFFFEKVFGYEFHMRMARAPLDYNDSLLLNDNERMFTELFFCGAERSLFFWNLSTFLFVDFLSKNYVLAAIVTYLLDRIVVSLRNSFGRRNLSRKTLIPKNFLI